MTDIIDKHGIFEFDYAKELATLREQLAAAMAENEAHRTALGRFLTAINPVGFDFDMKAEDAFEEALQCVIADREVRAERDQARAELAKLREGLGGE